MCEIEKEKETRFTLQRKKEGDSCQTAATVESRSQKYYFQEEPRAAKVLTQIETTKL